MNSSVKESTESLRAVAQSHRDRIPLLKKKLTDVYGINSGNSVQNVSKPSQYTYTSGMKNRLTADDIINKKKEKSQESAEYKNPSLEYASGKMHTPIEGQGLSGFKTNSKSKTVGSDNLVESAKKYLGTAYVWGGDSKSDGGLDCSGFVYNALKDSGKNVGRKTAQGYRDGGTKVDKNNLQPGDLVFFGKNGKASHIGIYAGNGQIIHSSGNSNNTKANPGKGVTYTSLDYRNDFLEARRY